jgi:hypothetical protein
MTWAIPSFVCIFLRNEYQKSKPIQAFHLHHDEKVGMFYMIKAHEWSLAMFLNVLIFDAW